MSIFKINYQLLLFKAAAVLMTALCCVLLLFPMCGQAEGAGTTELVFSKKLFHKHTGTAGVYGGCYTKAEIRTTTVEVNCKGTMVYYPEQDTTSCNVCAAGYPGDQSGRSCWTTTYNTIEETTYVLGCNMTESTQVGTLKVTQNTSEWAKSVTLKASYKVNSGVTVKGKPYIWNGAAATKDSEFEVTKNGTYKLKLNADSNVNTDNAVISVKVSNIDVTGPVISSYGQEPATEWTQGSVQIHTIETQDQQPDQSAGCGVHELPFSFDGGVTWTAENGYTCTENGTYEIRVRDKLENISSHSITVSNIDKTPPVAVAEYETKANKAEVTIHINAKDVQPDGTEGCGLHEQAYSYDGGINWSEDAAYTISQNSVVQIAVRDKLGNKVHLEENIGNIDSYGPQLEYTIAPETWTSGMVTVHLSAKDINEDGSEGIGLAEEWYSLDEGSNWQSEEEIAVSENNILELVLRDAHNNQSRERIVIDHIDRQAPKVSIRKRVIENNGIMKVELLAKAKDIQSGLEDKAYSWDGGKNYSDRLAMEVFKNGRYVVKVRDKAGNVGKAVIEVDDFREKKKEDSPEPEVNPDEKPEPTENDPESTEDEPESTEDSGAEISEEIPEQESVEDTESETVWVTLEELGDEPESIATNEIVKDRKGKWGKWLAILLAAALFLLLALLLFMVWIRSVEVYVPDHASKMRYMGRLWIARREERYVVNFPETMFAKCETTHFCFKPAWGFVQLHEEEEMYFYFPKEICMTHKICEKMEISLF